jgi:hypothetical protein
MRKVLQGKSQNYSSFPQSSSNWGTEILPTRGKRNPEMFPICDRIDTEARDITVNRSSQRRHVAREDRFAANPPESATLALSRR